MFGSLWMALPVHVLLCCRVCVCACVRACVRACVQSYVCMVPTYVHRQNWSRIEIRSALTSCICGVHMVCAYVGKCHLTSNTQLIIESFRSAFMLNVEWSFNLNYEVNVHHDWLAVILDWRKHLTKFRCMDFEWLVWTSDATSEVSVVSWLHSQWKLGMSDGCTEI